MRTLLLAFAALISTPASAEGWSGKEQESSSGTSALLMEIARRNRTWRQMSIDAIEADPAWHGGNNTSPPESGMRTARYLSMIARANPVALQDLYPKGHGTHIWAKLWKAELARLLAK